MSPRAATSHDGENPAPARFLRMAEVEMRVGLTSRTIFRRINEGTFPQPVPLGGRATGFLESEIVGWMKERLEARK